MTDLTLTRKMTSSVTRVDVVLRRTADRCELASVLTAFDSEDDFHTDCRIVSQPTTVPSQGRTKNFLSRGTVLCSFSYFGGGGGGRDDTYKSVMISGGVTDPTAPPPPRYGPTPRDNTFALSRYVRLLNGKTAPIAIYCSFVTLTVFIVWRSPRQFSHS